jgi:hypothetical protein
MKFSGYICLTLVGLFLSQTSFADGKIVKWVDKNGVTHYGDKPPMPDASVKSKELNNQGVIVNTIDQSVKNPMFDENAKQQSRKDAALLASYNSEDEIDAAMERNTRIDLIALDSLKQKLANLQSNLEKNKTQGIGYKVKKQPIPAALIQEYKALRSNIAFTQTQIDAKNKQVEITRQRYKDDKLRYLELKPRSYAITGIKDKQKSLVELESWRREAQTRVDYFQNRIAIYKRNKTEIPQSERDSYLIAVRELERADAEILSTKQAIERNQRDLSR